MTLCLEIPNGTLEDHAEMATKIRAYAAEKKLLVLVLVLGCVLHVSAPREVLAQLFEVLPN